MWSWRGSRNPSTPTTTIDRPTRALPRISPRLYHIYGAFPIHADTLPVRRQQDLRPVPSVKACGHTWCALSTPDGCCACLDRRPFSPSGYMHYIDGQGWQSGAPRSTSYCPPCQQNPLSSSPSLLRSVTGQHQDNLRPLTSVTPTVPVTPAVPDTPAAGPSGLPSPSTPRSSRKTCGHNHCALYIPTCCACADRRPHTTSYPLYVDGQGITSTGTRWSTYCSPCRDFHDPPLPPTHEEGTVHDIAQSLSETERRRLSRAFGGTLAETAVNYNHASPLGEMFRATPAPAAAWDVHANDISTHDPVQTSHTTSEPRGPDGHGNRGEVEEDLCKICFAAPQDALFLPCAHLVSCTSCAVLVLTQNAPSPESGHGEISGPDLIRRTGHSGAEWHAGQLGYARLRDITPTSQGGHRAVCPVCRDSVRRWIKVYRS